MKQLMKQIESIFRKKSYLPNLRDTDKKIEIDNDNIEGNENKEEQDLRYISIGGTGSAEETIDSYQLISNLSFCVIDLETTGGDHKYDKIIEIGLIKVEKLRIVKELTFMINPEIPIPEFVQRLTSIYQRDIAKSPLINEVINEILEFIGESILVAHNSSFDIPFLNSVLERIGRAPLKNPVLCTNLMTKYLIPEIMNSNLTYIGILFGINHKCAHRALEDARVTSQLLIKYLKFFIERRIKKVNHLYYPRKKYELDSINFHRKEYPIDTIAEKIMKVSTPLLITVKGNKGQILNIIPIHHPAQELDYIISKLNEDDEWDTVSVKMVGSFLKAFLLLNANFQYLSRTAQENIAQYLRGCCLQYGQVGQVSASASATVKAVKVVNAASEDATLSLSENEIDEDIWSGHFLVTPHLIQDHYSIWALNSLPQAKSELVFRYPSHQKKLFQFINGQIRQNKGKRKHKIMIAEILKPIYYDFLHSMQSTKDKRYFFFESELFKNDLKKFKQQFSEYLARKNHLHNYPREHI